MRFGDPGSEIEDEEGDDQIFKFPKVVYCSLVGSWGVCWDISVGFSAIVVVGVVHAKLTTTQETKFLKCCHKEWGLDYVLQ